MGGFVGLRLQDFRDFGVFSGLGHRALTRNPKVGNPWRLSAFWDWALGGLRPGLRFRAEVKEGFGSRVGQRFRVWDLSDPTSMF